MAASSSAAPVKRQPRRPPLPAIPAAEQPIDPAALDRQAKEVIAEAFAHGERAAISFSGAEDIVLIDLAARVRGGQRVPVFSLDTGRLHPETYRFLETVRERYPVDLELLLPDADEVADLVRAKGLFSFYDDGHGECCAIRKIQPLRRKLRALDAWITGQRADQSVTRSALSTRQPDLTFSTAGHPVRKFNPLAAWRSADVWAYIRQHDVPYNPLHDRGFRSIGCEPCTRAVGPHQHEREGRWLWEQAAEKECGLHGQNGQPIRMVAS